MDDVKKLFQRQAAWQKGRKSLPWPEKIRIAEEVRESILQIRGTGPGAERSAAVSRPDATPIEAARRRR